MTSSLPAPDSRVVAERLDDIAAAMAGEASDLTRTMRAVGDHAREIAGLAEALDRAAELIEENVSAQIDVLRRSRARFGEHDDVVTALAHSTELMAAMCSQVRAVAGQSRLLSFNARIEAARGGELGQGFAVIAGAMTELTARTHQATQDIEGRAAAIGDNVKLAGNVIVRSAALVEEQQATIASVSDVAMNQRTIASKMAGLTAETVERIDDAAVAIGRIASSASVVGLLARQLLRIADATAEASPVVD